MLISLPFSVNKFTLLKPFIALSLEGTDQNYFKNQDISKMANLLNIIHIYKERKFIILCIYEMIKISIFHV